MAPAQRGLAVLALEPDGAMAAVWRRNCAPYEQVAIECVEFESFRAREPFAALVCAQAWHWLDPAQRYATRRGRRCAPAARWQLCGRSRAGRRSSCAEPLREAYRGRAPGLTAGFPMHPASHPLDFSEPWRLEVQASGAFVTSKVSSELWSRTYSTSEYVALLNGRGSHPARERHARAAHASGCRSARAGRRNDRARAGHAAVPGAAGREPLKRRARSAFRRPRRRR